jgi:hypothetical protein
MYTAYFGMMSRPMPQPATCLTREDTLICYWTFVSRSRLAKDATVLEQAQTTLGSGLHGAKPLSTLEKAPCLAYGATYLPLWGGSTGREQLFSFLSSHPLQKELRSDRRGTSVKHSIDAWPRYHVITLLPDCVLHKAEDSVDSFIVHHVLATYYIFLRFQGLRLLL